MSRTFARITVTISPQLVARLEAFSKSASTSTSAIVEYALQRQLTAVDNETFLRELSSSGLSRRRSATKIKALAHDG